MPRNMLIRLAMPQGLGRGAVAPPCLWPGPALAKLNPVPSKDGAPPSPRSEAETDARNDALDDVAEAPKPAGSDGIPVVDLCRCP